MEQDYESTPGPAADMQTGLLTRFMPENIKSSKAYCYVLRLMPVLEFLSAVISLGIFSERFYKLANLVNDLKTQRGVSGWYDAVEVILVLAVVYTLTILVLSCVMRNANPGSRVFRLLRVLLDVIFVGAFIAVIVMTRPDGGPAGSSDCFNSGSSQNSTLPYPLPTPVARLTSNPRDTTCNLPIGTFVMAIFSAIFHTISAAFHEVRNHRRNKKQYRGVGQPSGQEMDEVANQPDPEKVEDTPAPA